MMKQPETSNDSSSPQIVNNQGAMNDGSTPETAVSYAEYVFPDNFLSNMTDYYLDEKTYKWKGRYVRVQFLISDMMESFQEFADSADFTKEYSIEDLTNIFGQPLFYMAGMDYYLTDENLPDRYTMVYSASWSDSPSASLGVDVENGKPTAIETKYYGWFTVHGISGGKEFKDFEENWISLRLSQKMMLLQGFVSKAITVLIGVLWIMECLHHIQILMNPLN